MKERNESLRQDGGWEELWDAQGAPPFAREDVAEVLGASVVYGDCAEMDIVILVRLSDGRFGEASAQCDTTGWDCQSGVSGSVHDTIDAAWAAVGDEGRDRLNGDT